MRWVVAVMLALLVAGVARADGLDRALAPGVRAPALLLNFPDPFVLADGDRAYAYATNATREGRKYHVQLAVSDDPDLRRWTLLPDAMPQRPAWVRAERPDIWAPEVMRVGGRYILYFTGRHATRTRRDGHTLCIGAAVADRPEGPFVPQAEPLVCDGFPDGVIDASPFADGGRLWLYVKSDGNCCRVPTRFHVLPLAPDGLAVAGAPQLVAGKLDDLPWEGGVIEAPTMVRHDGRLVMFFSGHGYGGEAYAMGYARCAGIAGPCEDDAGNPLLATGQHPGGRLVGPGHQSLFRFAGRDWIAYHGWARLPDGRRGRAMYVDPIRWEDGRPVIGRPPVVTSNGLPDLPVGPPSAARVGPRRGATGPAAAR